MSFDELIVWCQNHPNTPVARLLELARQITEVEVSLDEEKQENLANLWNEIEDLASKPDAN